MKAIILAGGYGSFMGPKGQKISKVTAHLGGKPMIRHILDTLLSLQLFTEFFVVINSTYGEQVKAALAGINNIHYPEQLYRMGSAGAVQLALEQMQQHGEALVTYGDMPLWSALSYQRVMQQHLQERASLTVTTIPIVPGTPVERYGRVVYDAAGQFVGIIDDPNFIQRDNFVHAERVNPSLYGINTLWAKKAIPELPFFKKNDGHPPERLMQGLVPKTHEDQVPLATLNLDDYTEALGVNTLAELREVRHTHSAKVGSLAQVA